MLFDGESALASAKTQQDLWRDHKLKLLAQPHFKRLMAERAIKGKEKPCHYYTTQEGGGGVKKTTLCDLVFF